MCMTVNIIVNYDGNKTAFCLIGCFVVGLRERCCEYTDKTKIIYIVNTDMISAIFNKLSGGPNVRSYRYLNCCKLSH